MIGRSTLQLLVKPCPKGPLCSPPIFDKTNLFVDQCLSNSMWGEKIGKFLTDLRFLYMLVRFWNNTFSDRL